MWVVMKAMPFSSLDTSLIAFKVAPTGIGQPQYFMPVFEQYDDAVEFANGDDVVELHKNED